MKIRTDFVTNSSSSSYCVSITIEDKKGKEYSLDIIPNDGDGNAEAEIYCNAEEIMKATSLSELFYIIASSLIVEGEGYSETEDNGVGHEEDMTVDYWITELSKYGKKIKKATNNDISQLKTIKFHGVYSAWGEASSGAGQQLYTEKYPDLFELAKRVAEGDISAESKLEEELEHWDGELIGGWSNSWSGGFMGSEGISVGWRNCADTLKEFAQKLVDGRFKDDLGEETVIIDLENKKILERKSVYIPQE